MSNKNETSETLHTFPKGRETLQPSGTFLSLQYGAPKKKALLPQTGFKLCSGFFEDMIYLLPKDNTILNTAVNGEPSYAWGKVIRVPNTKKGTNSCELRYDKDHHSPEEIQKFTMKIIGNKA
eukprot:2538024-Ditylum_brightwellii.AAC.1